jgi:hypothetical protein
MSQTEFPREAAFLGQSRFIAGFGYDIASKFV